MKMQNTIPVTASTDPSLLYLWEDRTLFLGAATLPIKSMKTAADMLVVYFEGESRIKLFDDKKLSSRCVLIKAGYELHLKETAEKYPSPAIIYLDPFGKDFRALSSSMTQINNYVHVGHDDEMRIVAALRRIKHSFFTSEDAYEILSDVFQSPRTNQDKNIDPRIFKVVELIKHSATKNLTLEQLAESVHLSTSRLTKLFKQQLGIPIRRYRLWHRLYVCSSAYANGSSLLESALIAGFSSQSHYTTAFNKLLGLNPSDVLCKHTYMNTLTSTTSAHH